MDSLVRIDETELRYWLRLSRSEISARAACSLLEKFKTPEAIFHATEEDMHGIEGVTNKVIDKLKAPPPAAIDADIAKLEAEPISLVPYTSNEYPLCLKEIYDPPPVLYIKGAVAHLAKIGVAIVGSRRARTYGLEIANSIASELAAKGITIISGGARGIDTTAHKGALSAGGATVAVLGCGVDYVYPPENKNLFEAISESGAIISEFPLGSPPEQWRFPPRNRLISGLSAGVLVCQSPESSGALITASSALEQGREVFAIPGNVDDECNRGCHQLIKDGACLVENGMDILAALNLLHEESDVTSDNQLSLPIETLNEQERLIVSFLSLDAVNVDTLIEKSGLPAPIVSSTLTMLEMKRVVKRVPGNSYVRMV